MFSRNTVTTIVAPSGLFGDSVTIPGNNPFLTPAIRDLLCTGEGIALGAACINNPAIPLGGVYRRAVEVGPRTDQYKTDYYDVRAGFRFNITHSIKADIYGAYGESTNTQTRLNYTSLTRIQQARNATSTTACTNTANSCVPLDLIGQITPAMAAFIGGVTSTIQRSTSLGQVHGVVSGDFGWTLPGASKPVSFAVGGEYRRYKASVAPDSLAQVPGELGGAGGAVKPVSGAYDVKEGFGELNIPLVSHKPFFDELTAEAGARYSSYKNFNTWTYKGGLTWAPDPALKFRGNYQRAVRAPNIAELFAPSVTGLTNLAVDPCAGSAPTTNANLAAICLAQGAPAGRVAAGTIPQPNAGQANQYGGGNLNLKPEVSDSFTVGFVAQPKNLVSGLSLTVDFFNIIVNNAITTPTPGDVIAACFNNITAASATSAACTGILRNPSTGALSGSSANTPGLPQPLSNLGRIATDGIDFSANYQHNLGFAKLDASLTGTWTDHSKFKATPSAINRECVGQYSTDCGFNAGAIQPKFVWNQRTTLKFDGVDLSLLWRHLGPANYEYIKTALFSGTIKNGPGTAAPAYSPLGGTTANFNHISPYDYFDLSAKFEIAKKIEITMTAFNLFDKQPPLVGATAGSTAQNSGNTFPSTYDPIGRRYAVSARLKF
jgi:outer membrane receptor protein involved in Fe transport